MSTTQAIILLIAATYVPALIVALIFVLRLRRRVLRLRKPPQR